MIPTTGKAVPHHPTWRTPPKVIEQARELLAIDAFELDCCAEPSNAVAPLFYTKEEDGLSGLLPWVDKWWCNPPYTREDLPRAADRAIAAWHRGHRGALLVPVSTSAKWYQRIHAAVFLQDIAVERHFRSRVQFLPPPGTVSKNRSNLNVVLFVGGGSARNLRKSLYL